MPLSQGDDRSDPDLMRCMGEGEHAALGILISRHLPRILRIAERVTGNPHDAEEIAQETFIRLWRAAATWRYGEARVDTWLYRVAVNLCIDGKRKKRPETVDRLPDVPSPEPGALEEVHAGQMNLIVGQLLARLSEKQRIALVLSYYEGLRAPQVADIMHTTPGAVLGMLHRGRQALKAMLIECGIKGWDHEQSD